MTREGRDVRQGAPVVALSQHDEASIRTLTGWVRDTLAHYRTGEHTPVDPGPMAPHFHTGQDGEEPHLHTHAHGQDPAHAGQSA